MHDAYEFHMRLRRLRTLGSMVQLFRKSIGEFGFDTFACGEVDLLLPERCVFYALDWPDRWRDFYLNSGLVRHDPVVSSLAYRYEPFTWTDLRRDRRFGELGRNALKLAAEHGWIQGIVVPMPKSGRNVGLVSLAGTREEIGADARGYLTLISIGFYLHARQLAMEQGFPARPAGLTLREVECIGWVARGHSDKDIASALGIAASTVHEFIEKAKRRLSARTRTQLAAIAVALGIVDPLRDNEPRSRRRGA